MRKVLLWAALVILAPGMAMAQGASALPSSSVSPAPSSATGQNAPTEHYSTDTTDIGTLLDDPSARAILEKHLPGMTTNEQIDQARAMTLKDTQQYNPDVVTNKVLKEIDADFAKLPVKK